MNLSNLQFNGGNISTGITIGFIKHQYLRRPYKEQFDKFRGFPSLTNLIDTERRVQNLFVRYLVVFG